MGQVIGFKENPNQRMSSWLAMLESKKNYLSNKNASSLEALNLADLDKRVYTYYLEKYVA